MDLTTFTCYLCGKTYNRLSTKEELDEERSRLWGAPPQEDDGEVCDPCFRRFMAEHGIGLQ